MKSSNNIFKLRFGLLDLVVALLLTILLMPEAKAQVITFDDLTDSQHGTAITDGYNGFTWNNFYINNTTLRPDVESGYKAGTVSSPNVAFNGSGDPASI